MALTDEQIREAGFKYIPLQQYLLNPFELPLSEEEDDGGSGGGGGGITFTNVGRSEGVNSGALNPTFTRENPLSTPAISKISSQNLSTYLGNPALQAKYENFAEYDEFMQSQLPSPGLIEQGITSIKDTFGRFFQPKIKGTLGDRLLNQSQSMTIPSLSGILGNLRSPFNPNSPTFNAALPLQLNFLEAGGATGDKFLIGRDPSSGLLKYGPDSVLAGQNVISGFGSNDYETQLEKYIATLERYQKRKYSDARQKKIDDANKELDGIKDEYKKEFDKPGGTGDQVADLQSRIERGDFDRGETPDVKTTRPGVKPGTTPTGGYGGGADMGSAPSSQEQAGPGFDDVGESGSFKKGGLAKILGY